MCIRDSSIFRADVTDLCHEGDNELTIEVSNEDTPSMYPASADFTFYGGCLLYTSTKNQARNHL